MDVIIVCHTEFGFVENDVVIYNKKAIAGARDGVLNLLSLAKKYEAKITFAIMPEVAKFIPQVKGHEIGIHIHPGWEKFCVGGLNYFVGDTYLREHCDISSTSTILRDYPYKEQVLLIKTGRDYLNDIFHEDIRTFVAGRWSINNDTIKSLIESGITHDCSASAHHKAPHFDWSKLPRICMPFHPDYSDYQLKGNAPLLILPISQMPVFGNVNPEIAPFGGTKLLKACFKEYLIQDMPFFHICLHSPSMTDPYMIQALDELIKYISNHHARFITASEVTEYQTPLATTKILPYLTGINPRFIKTMGGGIKNKLFRY
nr:hypothetical protein [uncultured Methanoregula sp.]